MFFISIKAYLPKSFMGLFIVSTFFYNFSQSGMRYALIELSKSLLAAEISINENVTLAVQNSPEYGFMNLLEIIFSVMVLWYLVKYIGKLFIKISGSQAEWGAYLLGVVFVIVIEFSTIMIILPEKKFIPFIDGLLYFFLNIDPCLRNIHVFGIAFNDTPIINDTISTTDAIEEIVEVTINSSSTV